MSPGRLTAPLSIMVFDLTEMYFQAENLNDYGAFLHNYGRATDTVKRKCQNDPNFAGIITSIKLKSLRGQVLSLEDLLHKPVARVQKNALVLDVSLSTIFCLFLQDRHHLIFLLFFRIC